MRQPSSVRFARPINTHAAMLRVHDIPLHFYRYLQFRVGKPWHWVYRLRMDDETLSAIVHSEETQIHVLYVDGAPSGFFELHVEDETVDLAYFGLMPHVHGRGLGKWFLGQAVETAWTLEPERVTVNTNTLDHHIALPLYQRVGFTPIGQTEASIDPLTDDDYIRLAHLD
ncbi:GNAT family N-acetyltransferase [Pararhizobium mangrovi]|uniref:GNAT family N-acetyltransferase n=1 Tax=Pararhizobium mangrovi TaxID=2590452 RepID=A0A506U5C9_9HYPH|nr:GNAT family N-acetyltransferase [Pararhizobium mangrovi]